MMLQRNQPIRVWGWAEPGEAVTVSLAGKQAEAKADAKGAWALELPAMKTGTNLELTVTGKTTRTLKNIILGDVWLCGGQSNMEMGLVGCLKWEEDVKAADYPNIRRIKINRVTSAYPEPDAPAKGAWDVCLPQTAREFTAVGFYFAREVCQKTGVPIGLIDANWSGSCIEPWITPEGMEGVPELSREAAARNKAIAEYPGILTKALDQMEQWIPSARTALATGAPVPPALVLPVNPASTYWCSSQNAMIHPITRFPIKGAGWRLASGVDPDAAAGRRRFHGQLPVLLCAARQLSRGEREAGRGRWLGETARGPAQVAFHPQQRHGRRH
jgi:sialate O-acetylesterase